MIAWENRFLTNLSSFRSLNENNEVCKLVSYKRNPVIINGDKRILLKKRGNNNENRYI